VCQKSHGPFRKLLILMTIQLANGVRQRRVFERV